MAFFDDLGKKLSIAGQTAVEKTKKVADIAKLNSYIYDEEKKIENNYREIGKLYITMHAEEPEAEFRGLIAGIRESEEKILGFRHQITEIKGVVSCPKCGAEVPVNAVFCSSCGAPMPSEAPAEEAVEEPVIPVEEVKEESSEEAVREETEVFGEQ